MSNLVSDRRTFIKRGLLTGGSLAFGAARGPAMASAQPSASAAERPPNILVVVVDQLRNPTLLPAPLTLGSVMPNLAALARRSVSFERHYTASNDCTPSRGTLVTGLYSHQTRCIITGRSHLMPGFPTWGTFLRQLGYETTWWGKWHLNPHNNAVLEPYGFSGGTYPSPNGGPGEGTEVDGGITSQFQEWFAESAGAGPWCSTVSFVNPHDIAWWFRYTDEVPLESTPPQYISRLPSNFETPEEQAAHQKPKLHHALQETAARSFGVVPFTGPETVGIWSDLMNTYLLLQSYVDTQIGAVLSTLAANPVVAANTIVVFTSDHGEYGGAHGMRGKGAAAYEEAIRVPLYVYDPRGIATAATGVPRTQLTSSVDIVGLLLSLATGSNSWRKESALAHLAKRQDLAAICANPEAPGRKWVLHATDEDVTEFAREMTYAEAPRHVIAIRTQTGKFGQYSNWAPESITIEGGGQENEFYDYTKPSGAAELVNEVDTSPLAAEMHARLEEAITTELRAALPPHLHRAQREGLANYLSVEEEETEKIIDERNLTPTEPMPG